jgi:outer membrane lipase/esterase
MKNYLTKTICVACLFAGLTFQSNAQQSFSDFIVFGDSLSDTGQFIDPLRTMVHPQLNPVASFDPLTFTTRENANPFSLTGNVWTQNLSLTLGLGAVVPSSSALGATGTNYAVAGYRNDQLLASITDDDGNVVNSVALFGQGPVLSRDGYLFENAKADGNALYVVWGGGNDIRDISKGAAATLVADSEAAADLLVDGVQALAAAGARTIIVPTLPDIGGVPENHDDNAALAGQNTADDWDEKGSAATAAYNARIDSQLAAAGLNVIRIDIFTLLNEILASPTAFGFSAEDHSAVTFDGNAFGGGGTLANEGVNGQNQGAPDASKYVFFDGIHPSAATHEIIADYVASILSGAAVTGALAEYPLTLSRAHFNQLERHFAVMKHAGEAGQIVPFVSGGRGSVDGDGSGAAADWDGDHDGMGVGASYRISESLSLGLAVGAHNADIDLDDLRADIEVEGEFVSLTSTWRGGSIFANTNVTFGDLDVESDRTVQLGPLTRSHSGDTDGDYLGFQLTVGCDLNPAEGLTVSPYVGIRYEDVEIDGYSEPGTASTSLNYRDQDREALLLYVGVDAEYQQSIGGVPVTLFGGVRFEHDAENDDIESSIGLNSAPGTRFSLDPYETDDDALRFDLGVQFELTDNVDLSVGYVSRIADDSDDQSVNVSLSLAF